jgi:ribosomal protein L4
VERSLTLGQTNKRNRKRNTRGRRKVYKQTITRRDRITEMIKCYNVKERRKGMTIGWLHNKNRK